MAMHGDFGASGLAVPGRAPTAARSSPSQARRRVLRRQAD